MFYIFDTVFKASRLQTAILTGIRNIERREKNVEKKYFRKERISIFVPDIRQLVHFYPKLICMQQFNASIGKFSNNVNVAYFRSDIGC